MQQVPDVEAAFKFPYVVMHRADFLRVLLQAAEKLGVQIRLDSQIKNLDFSTPSIELQSGERLKYDAIIAADGVNSFCRNLMHGPTYPPIFLGDVAYRVTIEKKDLQEIEGIDDLVKETAVNIWVGPDAHIVTYPLGTTAALNIVITLSTDHVQPVTGQSGPAADHLGRLRRYFESWDTRIAQLLQQARAASRWELRFCDDRQDWIHADGKVGLIGDACHAMLPYVYVLADPARNSPS